MSTESSGHPVDINSPIGQQTGSELRLYRRAGGTRTHDLLTPSQARYQAAPQPVAPPTVHAPPPGSGPTTAQPGEANARRTR